MLQQQLGASNSTNGKEYSSLKASAGSSAWQPPPVAHQYEHDTRVSRRLSQQWGARDSRKTSSEFLSKSTHKFMRRWTFARKTTLFTAYNSDEESSDNPDKLDGLLEEFVKL